MHARTSLTASRMLWSPTVFLLVRDDHPPHVGVAGWHDSTEADVAAGERLQLERDVLEDVREVGAFLQALDETTRLLTRAVVLREGGDGIR